MTEFFWKQLCWYLQYSAGKEVKISSSCWWHFQLATSPIAFFHSDISILAMLKQLCSTNITRMPSRANWSWGLMTPTQPRKALYLKRWVSFFISHVSPIPLVTGYLGEHKAAQRGLHLRLQSLWLGLPCWVQLLIRLHVSDYHSFRNTERW